MPPINRNSGLNDDSFSLTNLDDEIMGTSTRRVDEELDYDINTSTLDRAFPEFSQIQTSEEEEQELGDDLSHSDLDMSVELGRAATKPVRDDSRSSMMSFENSVRSSSPAIRVEYPTPQKPVAATRPSRRAVSENLRKNAQVRRATQAQKETMSPQVSKAQRDQRRTFSDMHAKVRDSYEGSFLGDERPAPIATKTRSTRFGNVNTSQEIADAIERASRDAYAKEMRKSTSNSAGTPRKSSANAANTNTIGDTMTHQSFLLPDLPNISELVSGVYEDGTPVYSRQGKMRSTRFVSPLHDHTDVSLPHDHMPLDAVPVPEDEKALFVHLRLLQDKVAELEMFKAEAERRMESYRQENSSLKANRPRQSSAKYESEDNAHRKGSKRLENENQKLDAANIALQNQLDIADRKAQVQESAIKRLNHERESAISQLGAAYLETRELKAENEELRQENADLKSQISRSSGHKAREQDTAESEASSAVSDDVDDSQLYTERSGDYSRSTRDTTSKSNRSTTRARRQDDSRSKVSTQVDNEISRLEKERADEALFSIEMRKSTSKSSKSAVPRSSESKTSRKQPNTSKQRVKRVVVEEVTGPEVSEQTKASSETELTLLSIIDEHEISRLRKTLEEERIMRKQRRSSAPKESNPAETINSTRQSILKTSAPRKSSLREPKAEIPRPASATGDITTASKANTDRDISLTVPIAERSRRHSENSLSATSQRKKLRNFTDMTSAFILPDITLHHVDLAAADPSKLSQATQKALDSIARHNGQNCTVCNGHSTDGTCNHESVKVTKPIPVSDRMPKPSVWNEEPTMRPSQPPAIALAIVLKGLEDELSHLKMQLATYQSAYNKLDASLGKRPRKALQEKIDKIFKDIDMKSDQIYALYDVLEGQKQDGREMTEHEMEATLESIGIDVGMSQAPDITGTTDKSSRHGQIDLDDEEDLPWEGIESTGEMTGHLSLGGH
ncbi:uncharacterized protein N7479_004185 [Penicillium vulpinum]|uniref:Cep57 centrosome microtubule-binding domain-containing protein n=1 Tax=Penicillium vulpinum TaxID=29845 RepID=A0A1V6SCD0_9EURO|nr:uncharacterized protein N7479_004185 [Penicillium vulpinum]KAJ5964309.1 hypothetical protein N7479_004185 [Penicillium vulpinum]OQE11596.1 hypothetical protein PENVUL_c002G06193 [Penicillium vulpinum]